MSVKHNVPRILLIALLLALSASMPFVTTLSERRDLFFLDIELTSTAPGATQLFWNTGSGFSDAQSSWQPLKAHQTPCMYRFMIPARRIQGFQLTANDAPSRVTLSKAKIIRRNGTVVRELPASVFSASDGATLVRISDDTVSVEKTTEGPTTPLLISLDKPLVLQIASWHYVKIGLRVFLPLFIIISGLGILGVFERFIPSCRRAGAIIRNRPRTAILLAALVCVIAHSHPVVFLGKSYVSPYNGGLMLYGTLPTLPGDTCNFYENGMASDVGAMLFHHLYIPMKQREALLEHHELPLWSRYNLCGGALLGQGQSMLGDPFNLITILANGSAWAWDLRFLIAHFLLATGIGFIVWKLRGQTGAAVVATISSCFIGYYFFRLNHPATFSLCYAPWIVVAWLVLIQGSTRRHLAAGLGMLILTNWVEFSSGTMKEATILMGSLNMAGLLMLLVETRLLLRERLIRATWAGAAGLIFLLLCAPLWMTFMETLRQSWTGYDTPRVDQMPWTAFISLFDEMFSRQLSSGEFQGIPSANFLSLLGLAGWFGGRTAWGNRPVLSLTITALCAFTFAYGIFPASWAIKIPFINNIHHLGNTFSCPVLILVLIIAGCGFGEAFHSFHEKRITKTTLAALVLLVAAYGAYFKAFSYLPFSPFFIGYAASLLCASLALVLAFGTCGRMNRPGFLVFTFALTATLLLWRHSQWPTTPFDDYVFNPGVRSDFFAKSASVQSIREDMKEPGRVIGFGNNLFPGYNSALRFESLYGVEALRNSHYQQLAVAAGLQRVWIWDHAVSKTEFPQFQRIYDMLNVAYYVGDRQSEATEPAGLTPIARMDLDVYRSDTVWPRAFYTNQIRRYRNANDFVAMVRRGDGKPFAAMEVDQKIESPVINTLFDLSKEHVSLPAQEYHLTPNTTSFSINAPAPGIAVLAEAYLPAYFEVKVNGAPAQFVRINHAFRGVAIPCAGTYHISYICTPRHLGLSLVLAAIGCIAALAVGVFLVRSACPAQTRRADVSKN